MNPWDAFRRLFSEDRPLTPSPEGAAPPEPIVDGKDQEAVPASQPVAPQAVPEKEPGDDRPVVLLVDDDADMVRFIVRALEDRYRIVSAGDGEEGLALAREMAPEVILTDIEMPRMDGETFIERLGEDAALSAIPLIILTAQTDEALRIRLLRRGVGDYLIKPFSVGELSVRLDNILRRRRAEAALARLTRELESRVADRTRDLETANRHLQTEVAERCQAESRLKASLSEKETLLKEVHHRVKNNLQLVYSLLNLQTRYVKDPKTLEGLQDCRQRVMAMALVHEKLRRSKELGRIPAREYFQDLVRHLFDSFGASSKPIHLELDVDPVVLHVDQAVPCGLIAYELVSNSLKHAFPDGREGSIRVSFHKAPEGRTVLTVEDDGAGLPPDLDVRNSPSLGLQLICNLTTQLDGQWDAERRPRGVAFQVAFNAANAAPISLEVPS